MTMIPAIEWKYKTAKERMGVGRKEEKRKTLNWLAQKTRAILRAKGKAMERES